MFKWGFSFNYSRKFLNISKFHKRIMTSFLNSNFVKKSEVETAKESIFKLISNRHIVLASSSPRRKEILELLGLQFSVLPSTFEEDLNPNDFSNVHSFVEETAKFKAMDILQSQSKPGQLIISADTIVELNGEILGKPGTSENAISMLNRLSGCTHCVISGVTLIFTGVKKPESDSDFYMHSFHDETKVGMIKMTPEIIQNYVDTGEPLDKAGAYGIQGKGGELVQSLGGDFFNVVGFPLFKFHRELLKLRDKNVV